MPKADTKALPGSFEERAKRIWQALKDADILPAGDVWVSDTFDDRVVVSLWSKSGTDDEYAYEQSYYEIEISAESDEGFEFGEVREVEKEYSERLVPSKGSSAPRSKRRFGFQLKSLTAVEDDVGGWEFEGHFSTFDYEDHSKDIVRRGSMKESVAVHLPKILDHHGVTVGQATTASEDDEGLYVKGRIYPTRAGEDLVKLMQPIETDLGPHAPVEQGSIGYSVLEGGSKRRQGGGFELTKLWIWEVSPVTFGDNDATRVGLKSMDEVNALPTAELLAYAGDVVRAAVDGADGAKALYRRRLADDRDLSGDQWKAVDALIADGADAVLELVSLKAKAGKAASNAHLRHMRAIIDGLATLIHGPTEPEPAPAATDDDEEDETKGDGAKARAKGQGAGGESPGAGASHDGSGSKDLRERDLIAADLGLATVAEATS